MDVSTYIAHLRRDGAALAAAALAAPDAAIDSCPGWSMRDLVMHTGDVHRRKTAVLLAPGTTEMPEVDIPAPPDSFEDLITWFSDGVEQLATTLGATDPDAVVWTWWPPEQKASFWSRRMAQETAVHRWDSEDAAGLATPLDAELAADGVEEMLAVHVPASEAIYSGAPGTVQLVATDRVASWWIHLEVGAIPTFERSGRDSDVTARGSASDVLLFLWRRIKPSALSVEGDDALLGDLWTYLKEPGT